jgi:hypothetical protein
MSMGFSMPEGGSRMYFELLVRYTARALSLSCDAQEAKQKRAAKNKTGSIGFFRFKLAPSNW